MGASSWSYFVPYQADIREALAALRQDVFQRGDYESPHKLSPDEEEAQRKIIARLRAVYPEIILIDPEDEVEGKQAAPKTIDELLERCGEDGTHSILDMTNVSDDPDFGTVSPLDEEDLTQVFGTIYPTHEMAETKLNHLMDLSDRWVGTYLVLYKDKQPDEILFVGCSGD